MMISILFLILLFEDINSNELENNLWRNRLNQTKENNKIDIFDEDIRLAIKDQNKKWSDRRIPYLISDKFLDQNKELIQKAIHSFKNTCIRLEAKTPKDIDYLFIKDGQGCNSPAGRQGGQQNVTLGEGCLIFNTIVHELMHSLGFLHEHQRYDRDEYLDILYQNIKRGMEYEFNKRPKSETTDLDFAYDYNSVMQYEETAFSKNGRHTMESKIKGIKLGPINGFSPTDIRRISKYYGCEGRDSLPNSERVETFDNNLECLDLKWKSFDQNMAQNLLVFGGNDSFGNTFYICRAIVDKQIISGHMFEGICYSVKNGREVIVQNFQVLTHSKNDYNWKRFTSNGMPSNAVITDKSSPNYSIGRCSLKYFDYNCRVVGTIKPNKQSIRQLSLPFNGIEIKCNEFEVLLCRTSKRGQTSK